jgi:hypothetical protein
MAGSFAYSSLPGLPADLKYAQKIRSVLRIPWFYPDFFFLAREEEEEDNITDGTG